jgi:hypothetical protein
VNSPADLLHTVEKVCGARFVSQKLSLFAETRDLLEGPSFTLWLYALFVLDSDDLVTDWLAESLPVPAAFLAKYLLFLGFYASTATDLREYALSVLTELEMRVAPVAACRPENGLLASPLPSPLYHNTAHDGLLM